jgi:hypothetical protein
LSSITLSNYSFFSEAFDLFFFNSIKVCLVFSRGDSISLFVVILILTELAGYLYALLLQAKIQFNILIFPRV